MAKKNHQMPGKRQQVSRLENNSKKSNIWLPDPIEADANALITKVGAHLTRHRTWGTAVRLLLVVLPKRSRASQPFSQEDCLAWLQTFSRNLAEQLSDSPRQRPYRMVAALEGAPGRGWFYSVILDLPREFSFHRLKAIIHSSMASGPDCYFYDQDCDGVVEISPLARPLRDCLPLIRRVFQFRAALPTCLFQQPGAVPDGTVSIEFVMKKSTAAGAPTLHGAYAQYPVLPSESMKEFHALHKALQTDLEPEGLAEEEVVLGLAGLYWKKRRVAFWSSLAYCGHPNTPALTKAGESGWSWG